MIGFDGKSIHFVEIGDPGIMNAKLINKNKMELIYVESGDHPVVFRVTLTREK